MGLKIEKGTTSEPKLGVFLSEATIKDVEDVSGRPIFSGTFTPDLGVKLTLDIGKEFYPEMYIAGNFGENDTWGSAFKVRELLLACGISGELTDDNKISSEILGQLIGRKFKRLSYRSGCRKNGKNMYRDWDLVFPINADNEKIREIFFDQVTKSAYLSKKYTPDENCETTETETINLNPVNEETDIKDNMPF